MFTTMLIISKRNDTLVLTVFGAFLCLFGYSEEVKVTEIEVPRYVLLGSPAVLKCHFKLEGEKLYSLNWWKDGQQFYQFIPKNKPKMVVFQIAGVKIDTVNSNLNEVHLQAIDATSEGEYKCEVVADAPYFNTYIKASNLSIIDPPDGPPVIRGQKSIYHPGEIIHLNCTSYRSRPQAYLKWEIFQVSSDRKFIGNRNQQKLVKGSSAKEWRSKYVTTLDTTDKGGDRSDLPHSQNVATNKSSAEKMGHHHSVNDDKRARHGHQLRRRKSVKKTSLFRRKKFNKSEYNEISEKFLIVHKAIKSIDEMEKPIITSSTELQYPVERNYDHGGFLKLRCSAHIKSQVWATEVTISLADVPVADPQQLPTLHGKESRRGGASSITVSSLILITSYLITR